MQGCLENLTSVKFHARALASDEGNRLGSPWVDVRKVQFMPEDGLVSISAARLRCKQLIDCPVELALQCGAVPAQPLQGATYYRLNLHTLCVMLSVT